MIRPGRVRRSDLESVLARIRKSKQLTGVCNNNSTSESNHGSQELPTPVQTGNCLNEHSPTEDENEKVTNQNVKITQTLDESTCDVTTKPISPNQTKRVNPQVLHKRIARVSLTRCDSHHFNRHHFCSPLPLRQTSDFIMDKGDMKTDAKEEVPGTSGAKASQGVKRKKIVYKIEPRTPLKRQRIPVQRFQSPAELEGATKAKLPKEEMTVLYKKGVFLAVRGDDSTGEGRFYICKAAQNVYSSTKQFKIQWLNLDQTPNIYKLDYMDHTEIECVLTNLKMERIARDTYRLPHAEQSRIVIILDKALKVERGELIIEDVEDLLETKQEEESEEESSEEDWEDEEPTPQKRRKQSPVESKSKSSKAKSVQKDKNKDQKKGKETKKKAGSTEKKKGPDKKLKPNLKIKVLEKEPLFETKEAVPFISKSAHAKLVIRAVLLNDMASLKSLLADKDHIYEINHRRSPNQQKTALHYAIDMENKEAIQLLVKDMSTPPDKKERLKDNSPQLALIHNMGTGWYNPTSLGISRIRAISSSRGCREGNDAFLKDEDDGDHDYVRYAMKQGVPRDIIELLITPQTAENEGDIGGNRLEEICEVYDNIFEAVLHGHQKLAGQLVEESVKTGSSGFGFLHQDVLQFETEDLRKNIMMSSVTKKPYGNKRITPLHCACINPNVKYLRQLLTIFPNMNIEDQDHHRLVHYAAVCVSTAPLQFLLERGASPEETDTSGRTALHLACSANKPNNVDLLLKHAQKHETDSAFGSKWGIGGINRPDRFSICPLHLAVSLGHTDIVKILLKYGVDVKKPLSAGKNRCTPLMLAASKGYLDIARLLVQSGAVVEQRDKLKRTALIHAAMNGNTNVLSYLLFLGADPDAFDSSSNSALHYAAAYGWYFCVRMLVIEGSADVTKTNDWKITPLGIAFLKGHVGLVDFLLKQPDSDINFKNDRGMTLVSVAVSSKLEEGLLSQVDYLLKKGADARIKDAEDCNSLHHLAASHVYNPRWNRKHIENNMDLSVRIAQQLLEAGCDPTAKTSDGKTPVMIAIESVNTRLVKLLVEKGGTVSQELNDKKQNILHQMALGCMDNEYASLLEILIKQRPDKSRIVEEMMEVHGIKTDQNKSKIVEEIMEVDGLNAEEAKMPENSVPINGHNLPMEEDERMTNAKMIRLMAKEVDVEGRTPLLTACNYYMNYSSSTEEHCERGRAFLRVLIDLARADVGATVQKKTDAKPDDLDNRADGRCVGWSALHYMTSTISRSKDKKLPGLELILQHKPDLELTNPDGKTALVLAVEANRIWETKLLLKAGANPNCTYRVPKSQKDSSIKENTEMTPLLKAATRETVEALRLLVKAGVDVHLQNEEGETALHLAVTHRENEELAVAMTEVLLNAKANINVRDKKQRTPLHLAVNINTGRSNSSTDLEELLLHRNADPFVVDVRRRLPLHYAFVKIGRWTDGSALDPIELCQVLTSAMDGVKIDEQDSFGQTPLHRAANRGAAICCMHLLQRKANISQVDQDGNTPLARAVINRHDSCAIMLIQKGGNVNDMFHVNVERKPEEEKKQKVVDKKTKPEWTLKRKEHKVIPKNYEFSLFQSAIASELPGLAHIILDVAGLERKHLEAAVSTKNYHVCLRLLKRMRDNHILQTSNNKQQNLLHSLSAVAECTASEIQLKVAKLFIERGVSASQVDCHGCTPLFYAVLNHHQLPLCQLLMDSDKSFDINKKNNFGRNLLTTFFWNVSKVSKVNRELWIELLVKRGASLDVLFSYPIDHHFNTVIQRELDYFEMYTSPTISPVILAINVLDMELLRLLLKQGASPNMPDSRGLTPMMHAVRLNALGLIKLLLNYDYDPEKEKQENSDKPLLQKKSSRMAFQIMRAETIEEKEISEEEMDHKEGDEDEMDEEVEEEEEDSVAVEDDIEEEEDSDHDTDVVEEEEETDTHVDALPRLGSKQLSLLKQGSSIKKDEFAVVEKKSSINLDARDGRGWTAIHHLVCPLDYGSYDREEILYVLDKAGADSQVKDNAGLTPLAHALIRGAPKLARRLQLIQKIELDKLERPTYSSFEVADNVSQSHSFEYEKDAAEMLKKLETEAKSQRKEPEKCKCLPDEQCSFKDNVEVLQDLEQDIPYDALSTKIDVAAGHWGIYNFYRLQILYMKGKEIYILFTRWGRIGDSGQFQQTPFQKRSEAVSEFCKIFKSKTGNYWSNVKTFNPLPKKYRIVQKEKEPEKHDDVKFKLESDLPCKLHPYIQDLLKEMSSVQMLSCALKKVVNRQAELPFGWVKKEALIAARKLLEQISELITVVDKQAGNLAHSMAEYQSNCEKLYALSNEYYTLMPSSDYTRMRIPPITTTRQVRDQTNMLVALLDIELASKILLGAQLRIKEINPLDYLYHCMGCKIQLMKEDEIETQNILKSISSSGCCAVEAIYKLSRPGEDERLRKLNQGNHHLLWHGSDMANFISILTRGLLRAPPEVSITGHLFGEGIYNADCFSKSRGYCYNSNPLSNVNLMLLSEVSLGNMKLAVDVDTDIKHTEIDSLKILGHTEPDPTWDLSLPFGAVLPLGNQKRVDQVGELRPYMTHNEYIVQDPAQICLRYLIQFR
ncbi:hypothetical protein ScPMuIL_014012 [Solemya velum]